jgi:hypothetical protein
VKGGGQAQLLMRAAAVSHMALACLTLARPDPAQSNSQCYSYNPGF